MTDASDTQTSFLGGEVSEFSQGQFDKPWYKMALAKAYNFWITDESCLTRRPGFRFLGITRNGGPGRLIPFDFTQIAPYNIEVTDGYFRFWNDRRLVTTNNNQIVTNISSDPVSVFTVANATTWLTGEGVTLFFNTPQGAAAGAALLNRQYTVTMLTSTTFTLADAQTGIPVNVADLLLSRLTNTGMLDGSISSSPISDAAISASPRSANLVAFLSPIIQHIYQIPTPYFDDTSTDWHSLRLVQSYNLGVFLQAAEPPQALTVVTPPTATTDATFLFLQPQFQDGPYLDPPPNAIATPNAISTLITLTVGYNAYTSGTIYGVGVQVTSSGVDYQSLVNNNVGHTPVSSPTYWKVLPSGGMVNTGLGFVATDIGRLIRLFSEPPIWDYTVTYSAGQTVTYNGSYFSSLISSNTNNQPDISLSDWVINTSAAAWTWGIITTVNSSDNVTVQLQGGPILYTSPIRVWRMGAWSNTTGWPTCGCYQEGRFWFAGAIPNRFDSSSPNQPFNMAPTLQDGTVADNSGISYTLNADDQNPIFWMELDHQGILAGTQEGEFLITSGTSGAPMTPSNIQAHRETKYGSSNILPVRTGLTLCFVKRYAKRVLEYLADIFSGRFFGPDLTTKTRHLAARIFEELAYQEENVPTVWGRMADGSITGTTYRRLSLMSSQEPEFNAWHQHRLGSGRLVESICVGPSVGGTLDAVGIVSNDPSNNVRFVEQQTTLMDETQPLTTAWYLDSAVTPPGANVVGGNVIFGGLTYMEGRTVSVFAAGIDCGDFVVAGGQVSVPLGTTDPITGSVFNELAFQLLQPKLTEFVDYSCIVIFPSMTYNIPCVIGYNYQSQGQLLRPQLPQATGAKNGPGHGKKRRIARYAMQFVNSLGVQVGTDFNTMYDAPLGNVEAGGKNLEYLDMYSGIVAETLNCDWSFDGQIAWQTTRPYPATVTNISSFISTEDK